MSLQNKLKQTEITDKIPFIFTFLNMFVHKPLGFKNLVV